MLRPGHIMTTVCRLLREDDGPSATEYAILLALIVLVAVAAVRSIGTRMQGIYQSIDATMPTG
jgi:pilus assembly protein Flp/PilA